MCSSVRSRSYFPNPQFGKVQTGQERQSPPWPSSDRSSWVNVSSAMMRGSTRSKMVRHGQPQLPTQQKYYLGRSDVPLSDQGVRQAQWLRQFFWWELELQLQIQSRLVSIYHSPLQRCRRTAEIIADGQLPCTAVDGLQEISMGQWEMLPMEQLKRQQPEAYRLRGELLHDGQRWIVGRFIKIL